MTEGRTIRGRDDNGQRQAEEGHACLNVQEAFFYVDDRMVASTEPGWLQTLVDTLKGIINRVGLRTNVQKTVGMVCQPCRVVGVRAYEAYKLWMTGEGRSYQERQRERVQCMECRKDLSRR